MNFSSYSSSSLSLPLGLVWPPTITSPNRKDKYSENNNRTTNNRAWQNTREWKKRKSFPGRQSLVTRCNSSLADTDRRRTLLYMCVCSLSYNNTEQTVFFPHLAFGHEIEGEKKPFAASKMRSQMGETTQKKYRGQIKTGDRKRKVKRETLLYPIYRCLLVVFFFRWKVCLRQKEKERNVIDRWNEEWMKMGGEQLERKGKNFVWLLLFVCLEANEPKDHRSVSLSYLGFTAHNT